MINTVVKLGVTGLSRAGKTAFITSLVNNLLNNQELLFINPILHSKIRSVYLEPVPNLEVPRFAYEKHLDHLDNDNIWPESTSSISQLRLTIEYEPSHFIFKQLGNHAIHLDIVDYPGEWLLDLPFLNLSYQEWSHHSVRISQSEIRKKHAVRWLEFIKGIDPQKPCDDYKIEQASDLFKEYLLSVRDKYYGFSEMSPGRFLMPGDFKGAPAVTYTPLIFEKTENVVPNSYLDIMQKRFEAYKKLVVKPFFQNHFVNLDRQVVLVDVLNAINGGSKALEDLKSTLSSVLACFNTGKNTWLSRLWVKRIDKIAFAASKADQLHHSNHDRMNDVMSFLVKDAMERIEYGGADIKSFALASVRSTHEGVVRQNGQNLPCILGTPKQGEKLNSEIFDGSREVAIFPGDLPSNVYDIFRNEVDREKIRKQIQIVNFAPPKLNRRNLITGPTIPHIRMDRVIEYLIGDKFL